MESQRVRHHWATHTLNFLIYIYVCVCKTESLCCTIFSSFSLCFGHITQQCGTFPNQESNPHTLHWKHGVLTTRPPGKPTFCCTFEITQHCQLNIFPFKKWFRGLPLGLVSMNPPCNARDQFRSLVRELRSHMPWGNWDCITAKTQINK